MSWLVELLIPVVDGTDATLPALQARLVERFGGVTAYERSPGKGRWRSGGGEREAVDDIVLIEVMAPDLDRRWWGELREWLEARLAQEEIVVRAHRVRRL